jgi:hypothetical protein
MHMLLLKEILTSQTIGIGLSVDQFETLVATARTATKVNNLGADNTGTFHNQGIGIVFRNRTNRLTTAGLYADLLLLFLVSIYFINNLSFFFFFVILQICHRSNHPLEQSSSR